MRSRTGVSGALRAGAASGYRAIMVRFAFWTHDARPASGELPHQLSREINSREIKSGESGQGGKREVARREVGSRERVQGCLCRERQRVIHACKSRY